MNLRPRLNELILIRLNDLDGLAKVSLRHSIVFTNGHWHNGKHRFSARLENMHVRRSVIVREDYDIKTILPYHGRHVVQ
jgi:hypothetical protein